jgi:hypothetical protein
MSDETDSEVMMPLAPATEDGEREDQSDLAGKNILSVLQKAAGLAEGNSRYAVDIALRLSDQLCAAENRVAQLEARVAELEAEAQHCREKSERAEQWLSEISNEIQQQVTGKLWLRRSSSEWHAASNSIRKNPRQFASLIVAGKLVQRILIQLVQDIRQSVALRATCGKTRTVMTSKRANEGVAVLSAEFAVFITVII